MNQKKRGMVMEEDIVENIIKKSQMKIAVSEFAKERKMPKNK